MASTVHEEVVEAITLESIAARLDSLGKQMNWLCENLQGLFVFVNQVGQNGGGLRGMMAMLKKAPPELIVNAEDANV